MEKCTEHADYALPNRNTRVKFLLDFILNNDVLLQAAIAMVRNDQGPDSMISNVETTASCFLPCGLVAKIKSAVEKMNYNGISEMIYLAFDV